MADREQLDRRFPLRLTAVQRRIVAELFPDFSARLKLDEANQRLVSFSLVEMREIFENARRAVGRADSGMTRNSLRHIASIAESGIQNFQGIGRIPAKERLYQFKITLKYITPPIWRRIQTRDCTIDKLHDRIQNAMGWTNSHLHDFRINKKLYGDPWLMEEDFEPTMGYINSRVATLSKVVPWSGERFHFEYRYDFGDDWLHDVLFEGCLRAAPGQKYPLCVEGERACPPEDVGGTSGYKSFLRAIANPRHQEHDENLIWVGGSFDPEHFDPEKATKRMLRGLPDWRKMA
jgi:Plasmid pRiA4b ORF-3-like protein